MTRTRLSRWIPRLVGTLLVAAAVTASAYTSVWTVSRSEQGVVLRFGEAVRTVPPGIHLTLPWPIETMVRVSTTDVRQVSVGFKLVDEALSIPPTDNDVQWLTGDTNIVDLRAIVYYTRSDPVSYLFRSSRPVIDPESDIALSGNVLPSSDLRKLVIRKATESVLTELMARMNIDDVLSTGKATLQTTSIQHVQRLLDDLALGVTVSAIDIVEVNPPRDVLSAFTAVTSSKAERDQRITEAQGDRNRAMPRVRADADKMLRVAQTYRNDEINRARGEADRFNAIAAEISKDRDFGVHRLWIEAMAKILPWVDVKVTPKQKRRATRIYIEE